MQITGPVTIGTQIEHADLVDASIGKTVIQQNLTVDKPEVSAPEEQIATEPAPIKTVNLPSIHLRKGNSKKEGLKHNLFRVIGALYLLDYFIDDKGKRPFQKDVFNAFGAMLGEDFSDHDKDLVKIRKGKTREEQINKLFDELANAAKTFTQD